jgi:ADP-dependent NAD(P)H-hydrate dehydratase
MNTPDPPCPPLLLPSRQRDSHKGDYGRVLLVGGSRGMAGSISLSAMSAMRTGSGLVTVLIPDRCLETVACFDPCLMTIPAPENAVGQFDTGAMAMLETHSLKVNAIGIGPGMGTAAGSIALVTLACCLNKVPRVFDADALNILAQSSDEYRIEGPAVLTPHPGEMQRLTGASAADREGQIEAAVQLALELDVVVLLKGTKTLVTDGKERWFNTTGNPGMAKGGSGDCLTGIITSLLGQSIPPYPAAKLGAYIHGLAGDLAAAEIGQASMLPTDLMRYLAAAMKSVMED